MEFQGLTQFKQVWEVWGAWSAHFALPNVTTKVIDLENDDWVMCPNCDEAWQDRNIRVHEMVKCPKCESLYLSPFKGLSFGLI